MFTVYYTDDSQEQYNTLEELQAGVEETILGCNFAVDVENICDAGGTNYGCTWSLKVEAV